MFTQYLANSFSSPASIKNAISGAKTWISNHLGQAKAFDSPSVQELLKKFTKDSNHVPKPALPITEVELDIITRYIDSNPVIDCAVKPCILLSFYCMLRASNVISPSLSQWGGAHTLRVSDIILNQYGLLVIIRSTKTLNSPKPHSIQVLPSQVTHMCPVRAWARYVTAVKPPGNGPAFMLQNHRPLTVGPVVSVIRAALVSAGYVDCNRYSMHSFRRGSVQVAERLGVPHADIMEHGLWRSRSGLDYYTTPVSSVVSQTFARELAN